MTVFISCSGSLSTKVAELLHSWLPDVIQGVKPWLYSEDIDKGALWPEEIDKALATTVGILCVTQENKTAPWLLFEAGGLFKGLGKARVCPLLIDLESQDIKQPLARFNFTRPNRKDMWKLVKTINNADPTNQLPPDRLQKFFDRVWSEFEKPFEKIRESNKRHAKPAQRTVDDMVIEVLNITRELQRNSEDQRQLLTKARAPLPSGYSAYSGYPLAGNVVLATPEENRGLKLYLDELVRAALERIGKKEAKETSSGKASDKSLT